MSEPAAAAQTVHAVTRLVAAVVALAALAAFVILFLVPDRTAELFSWTISPTMTSRLMGAGYLAGFYLFLRVVIGVPWRAVRAPVLGLVVFSIITTAATALHLERFHHGQLPFYVWIGLYAFLAVAMLPLWLVNERSRLTRSGAESRQVSPAVRRAAVAGGVGSLALAASLFFVPDMIGPAWPWDLTPLTARGISAWYATAGVMALVLGTEPLWSGWRIGIEAGLITLGALLAGTALSSTELDTARPLTWIYLGGTAATFVALLLLYLVMRRRPRQTD